MQDGDIFLLKEVDNTSVEVVEKQAREKITSGFTLDEQVNGLGRLK
jgi:hypothetical protein